jgi:predicted RNA-binding Zn ribbon-like protein
MDETLLLDLLNTTPVVAGRPTDELADAGPRWLTEHGQPASEAEWHALTEARDVLQDVVRGDAPRSALARFVADVGYRASLDGDGVAWTLAAPTGRSAAARAVLAWNTLRDSGRLRPCANPECQRFLIDHSKPNSARWCSMALCGNRLKARRHYERTRQPGQSRPASRVSIVPTDSSVA